MENNLIWWETNPFHGTRLYNDIFLYYKAFRKTEFETETERKLYTEFETETEN